MSDPSEQRRTSAERARLAHLRTLREPPFSEADRDRGLEASWHRRLAGCELVGPDGTVLLRANGSYTFGDEAGAWSMSSNVGRAMLMLRPEGRGAPYGYVVTREGARWIGLNGEPYRRRPAS